MSESPVTNGTHVKGVSTRPRALKRTPPGPEADDIIICRGVHKWFGELHVLNDINVTVKQGEVLVAAKHQSFLDILMIFEALPRPKFIMKKELRPLPFFGWFAWKTKMIAVDRSGHAKALKDMARGYGKDIGIGCTVSQHVYLAIGQGALQCDC